MSNPLLCVADPLAGLPSMLAVRDLHRRMSLARAGDADDATLRAMLRLDPPAAMRALRAAAAPVLGLAEQAWTTELVADAIGPSLMRKTFETPLVDVIGTAPLRQLWLHSLATAHAARRLAAESGAMPPEEAYLLGLLHDASTWAEWIGRRQAGAAPGNGRTRKANVLPPTLAASVADAQDLVRNGLRSKAANPASLLAAAELLAESAGFLHPGDEAAPFVDGVLDLIDADANDELRADVERSLRLVGLDLDVAEPDLPIGTPQKAEPQQAAHQASIEAAQLVLTVLGDEDPACRARDVIAATTAAAVRHLAFDRACFGTLVRATGQFALRGKHDRSDRPIATPQIAATAAELQALQQCLQQNRPLRLVADPNAQRGLLHALSAVEAIAVPVNRKSATPSFLLLDRTLSARPLQLLRDSDLVSTLAVTAAMRMQNLLLQRRCKRAQKFALTDPLTRLYNRRMGIASLDQAMARSQRSGVDLTVLMIDLDQFKKLNDTYGHVQGDQALRATADVLRKTLRRSDTICRYGGEEFMVVLPETSTEEAAVLATRLFTAVEARGHEEKLPITVSIGQASVRHEDSAESLLNRADKALYASKAGGRNRFSIADED